MSWYSREGADITDEALVLTEEVTINSVTYYRGRAAQVAGLSVLGDTSATYGVWTAVSKGGSRLTVVAAPGLPADADEVAWDCVAGWVYSTTSRTVYGRYRGHGSFSPTLAQYSALDGRVTVLEGDMADRVEGPASATDNALVRYDGTTGKLVQNSGATLSDVGLLYVPALEVEDAVVFNTPLPVASGGTGANTAANARTALGLGTGDVPSFLAVTTGNGGSVTATIVRSNSGANTGIYFPNANEVGIAANGVLRALVTTSGLAVTGAISATGGISGTTGAFSGLVRATMTAGTHGFSVERSGGSTAYYAFAAQNSATAATYCQFGRARGTVASPTALESGDRIGGFLWKIGEPLAGSKIPAALLGRVTAAEDANTPGGVQLIVCSASQSSVLTSGTEVWDATSDRFKVTNLLQIGNGARFGDAGPTFSIGTGSPESVVTAPVGSVFLRSDGGASTTLYVKESGTGNTGWIAK